MARSQAIQKTPSRILHEVEAILCGTIGVALVLSFVSYMPESPAMNHVGPVGYAVSNLLIQCFGYAAYLFPASLLVTGATLFMNHDARLSAVRAVGGGFLLIVSAVGLGLYRSHVAPEAAGGWIGGFLATVMEQSLGRGGSAIVLGAMTLLIFMMVTGRAISDVVSDIVTWFRSLLESVRDGVVHAFKRTRISISEAWARIRSARKAVSRAATSAEADRPIVYGSDDPGDERAPEPKILVELPANKPKRGARGKASKAELAASQEEFIFDVDTSDFRTPPVSLLGKSDDRSDYVDESTLISQSQILEQKLGTFGVNGRVTAVRPGPIITTYEFEPESGVKVSRVQNLSDDLTMAMRAHGVRIVAPIPGKNVVGIEVSNRKRAVVGLRDLIDAVEFRESKSALTLALGRDTTGLPAYADLAKMPHLLMAGATGTGKSVALNAYIVSILYGATPSEVRFIMIDPKMLELSLYEGIPHLLVPVVTDVKKASAALRNVMLEMERRFELMKEKRVRGIDDYNRRVAEDAKRDKERAAEYAPDPPAKVDAADAVDLDDGDEEEDETPTVRATVLGPDGKPPLVHEHLPRIVVIVDELADLMMTVGREVEEAITRLAQKARAAGIHLIVATQRPSVDVITGLIKANFPSRISFQVTSRPDSRTILDAIGADRLLGNGDLLYMAPGTSFLRRLHGPLITDEEIGEVVEFLKKQGDPDYRMEMLESGGGGDGDMDEPEFFDELYDRAVDLVTQHGQGSTSWVQRKLGIGYNRAARIMEHMEREGVVGPGDGSKPRQVLAQAITD